MQSIVAEVKKQISARCFDVMYEKQYGQEVRSKQKKWEYLSSKCTNVLCCHTVSAGYEQLVFYPFSRISTCSFR